jgi:hypothetical protein
MIPTGRGAARGHRAAARASGRRQSAGADPGDEGGEADGDAAQAGPDQGDQRPCESLGGTGSPNRERIGDPMLSGDGSAQPVDREGEAVCRGERGGRRLHEQNKNII